MNKKIFLGILGCLAVSFSLGYAANEMSVPPQASSELGKLKTLVGLWEGTSAEEGTENQPAKAEYTLSSGGSALIEKLFAGTPHEMTSVYYDTKGKLGMTHYCMLGNHPELELQSENNQKIDLVLSPASSIGIAEPHMHALSIDFKDGDHITQTWTYFENGEAKHSTVITLSRVK